MTGAAESSARSDFAQPSVETAAARAHRAAEALRGLADGLVPWLDLFVRAYLGLTFLRIAIRGAVMGIPMAMAVGGSGFFDAFLASPFGFTVQALCPVLLIAGAATRLVAVPLVIQEVLLTSPTGSSDLAHFRAALLLLIVMFGPGGLSVDRLLGRGLDTSAIPGVGPYAAAGRALTDKIGPAALLILRVWVASGPAAAAWHGLGGIAPVEALGFVPSVESATGLISWAAFALAAALALGLGTRAAAVALLLALPLAAMGQVGGARLPWALLLCTIALRGAGVLSLDALLAALPFRRSHPTHHRDSHHVVVVGGGFGGIASAKGLCGAHCRVTVVDRNNHHLFQPLLYQVATAALSPADIATPIRALLRNQRNASVRLDEAAGILPVGRELLLVGGRRLAYDTLIIATGARHGYFGNDGWALHAPGLKSIDDATAIRGRLLAAFEQAETADDPDVRRAWLTFVVVGGGPTGVELAGAIAELARHGLSGEFRSIDPDSAAILLVQAGPRLLPAFPPSLSDEAAQSLSSLGVDLRLDARVESADGDGVVVSGVRITARTVLWAAGVEASPAAVWLDAVRDRAGRIVVEPDLTVPGHPEIFVVGDTAASNAWRGSGVPGLAPAARQGGAYAARVIRARLRGRPAPPPFRYRHLGSLATIGRQAAVADFKAIRFRGGLAWWLWSIAHIAFIYGGRNRLAVLLDWAWAYLTYRRGTRLITQARVPSAVRPSPKGALHDG